MDRHVHLIGILWIVYGVMGLCFGLLVFLILFGGSFLPGLGDIAPGILRIGAWAASLFFVALALPQIAAGAGLLRRREWARILTLVVSFFHLVSFPLGTALAVYSFIILLKPETIDLFGSSP